MNLCLLAIGISIIVNMALAVREFKAFSETEENRHFFQGLAFVFIDVLIILAMISLYFMVMTISF